MSKPSTAGTMGKANGQGAIKLMRPIDELVAEETAGLGDHFGGTLMPAWSRIIASVARPLSDRL
jgi:hypothetical protein